MNKTHRIAINGFGRIGRSVLRILSSRPEMNVVGINDLGDAQSLAHLFKYDSNMGPFQGTVKSTSDGFAVNDHFIPTFAISDPKQLPWKKLGVDVVIEATGRFKTRSDLNLHLSSGAKKVLLTVPAKDDIDATIVLGVNDHTLKKEHLLVSNASCTTNCFATVLKVLGGFGIERAMMTTIHAYTNDQRILDLHHEDPRRARAAALNMIPTTTGAAKAVSLVMPELKGKIADLSVRVPVSVGSLIDVSAVLSKPTDVARINAAFESAASSQLKHILQFSTEPLVSSDIKGNTHSAVVDGLLTQVHTHTFAKVVAWYDNEYGYSARVVDLCEQLCQLL